MRFWQACCFALGWMLLIGALVAPVHWLGERLFVAHMVEHEILMAASAPLLIVAQPIWEMLWALPQAWRRGLGAIGRMPSLARTCSFLTNAPVATILHGVALWVWHIPALYEAALADPWLHWLQHVSFFGTALAFTLAFSAFASRSWLTGQAAARDALGAAKESAVKATARRTASPTLRLRMPKSPERSDTTTPLPPPRFGTSHC